jgi:acetyl-CoA synthetase (ADP-forming)
VSDVIEKALAEGRKHLAENEVKGLLRDEGIPTTDFKFFHDISELDVDKLSYPVTLKVCSPDILHKTDVGGIVLDIDSPEDFEKSYRKMSAKFPGVGLMVEPMYDSAVEAIIGLVEDPSFGLTIMFGIGGIFTEIYKDVTFRIVPIKRADAEEMLSEIKAAPVLEGFRNIKIDRKGLVDLLMKISELGKSKSNYIDQMDLNPVFLDPEGVRVIDAKMILK